MRFERNRGVLGRKGSLDGGVLEFRDVGLILACSLAISFAWRSSVPCSSVTSPVGLGSNFTRGLEITLQ